jgi:menaquinone-dependent protoporphyrinogen oxidase
VTARSPEKATIEGNRYMQKFLEKSPWRPRDLKVLAGKVDYPNWGRLDTLAIQMIMKFTGGPTDRTTVKDYTDWDEVTAYARHVLALGRSEGQASTV